MKIKDIADLFESLEEELNEIEVVANSVKEALEIAASEFNTEIYNLEYEILESGSSGFLGIGKKPYRVLVRSLATSGKSSVSSAEIESEVSHLNGKFWVVNTADGIFVKVVPPQGKGKMVSLSEVVSELQEMGVTNFDERVLRKEIETPSSEPIRVAPPIFSSEEVKYSLEITPDESKAFLHLDHPSSSSAKLPTVQEILELLSSRGIVYGINQEEIKNCIFEKRFDIPVEVASWDPPIPGKDAQIKYYFNTNVGINLGMIGNESIDFHKILQIENVVKGQVLAAKEPATLGKPGKTIRGRVIPATNGRDVSLANLAGKNVQISENGLELIALEQGQVVMKNGKINIEPIYEVLGDVATETGDIDFIGNVIVRGNVRDTFKVKAGGNVDIWGTVEKAEVVADGNVVIRTGIQGKEAGTVIAGGDVIAKFIERANVKSGGNVIVMEYILHSRVSAKNSVICLGRKASIAGGHVRAFKEIVAKQLGAESWIETVLEAGTDPDLQEKHDSLIHQKEKLSVQIEELKKELSVLQQLISSGGRIPEEKKEKFNSLNQRLKELSSELDSVEKELNEIKNKIEQATEDARISAYDVCYPNVKAKIRDSIHICKDLYKFITFKRENRTIIIVPYEESQEFKSIKEKTTKQLKKF